MHPELPAFFQSEHSWSDSLHRRVQFLARGVRKMGLSKPTSLSSSDPRVLQTLAPPLPICIPFLISPEPILPVSNAFPTRSQPRRRIPLQTAAASCVPWHQAHSRQLPSNGTRFGTSRLRRADRPLWTVNLDLHRRYRGTQPAVAYTRGNIGRKSGATLPLSAQPMRRYQSTRCRYVLSNEPGSSTWLNTNMLLTLSNKSRPLTFFSGRRGIDPYLMPNPNTERLTVLTCHSLL